MLTPDQETLLLWIKGQPDGATLTQMEQQSAPCFNRRRLQGLYDSKLLYHNGAGVYMLTDLGVQALLELQQARDDRAQQQAEKRQALRNQVISAILGSALTLIVEHFDDITAYTAQILNLLIRQ